MIINLMYSTNSEGGKNATNRNF